MEFKTCGKCGQTFPATTKFFCRNSSNKDGLQSWCKVCKAVLAHTYYEGHQEERMAYNRAYYGTHKEEAAVYRRIYYDTHKEQMAAAHRVWLDAHKEEAATYDHIHHETHKEQEAAAWHTYYETHKEQLAAAQRVYRETHKEETAANTRAWRQRNREHMHEYAHQRYQGNPQVRLRIAISTTMRKSLRGHKSGRHWEDLVGYTLDDLMRHLEPLFQPGMSWETYGLYGWHIDHIKPEVAFTYDSPDDPQFKECWALSNLQPLWAKDNMSKGAKVA